MFMVTLRKAFNGKGSSGRYLSVIVNALCTLITLFALHDPVFLYYVSMRFLVFLKTRSVMMLRHYKQRQTQTLTHFCAIAQVVDASAS